MNYPEELKERYNETMETIWLVMQESNVDGQILFNIVPCASMEKAVEVMEQEVSTLLHEGHFAAAREYMEGDKDMDDCNFTWENDCNDAFYIEDLYDDYYEDIRIIEKKIRL